MDCNVIVSIEDYTLIICFDRDVIDTGLVQLAIAAIVRLDTYLSGYRLLGRLL